MSNLLLRTREKLNYFSVNNMMSRMDMKTNMLIMLIMVIKDITKNMDEILPYFFFFSNIDDMAQTKLGGTR